MTTQSDTVTDGLDSRSTPLKPTDRLGRPLHDLRISLLDRCNFRCPYCMPISKYNRDFEFLQKSELLSYDEILRVVRISTQLGVSKIRLTGGEPLLDRNICDLIEGLTSTPGVDDLALTTNGSLLGPFAARLKNAGLMRLNISLDSLDPVVFKIMNGGRGDLSRVKEGIDAARLTGFSPIKINAVVKRSVNDHTVLDMLKYFRGTGIVVRFIEYMDVGNRNEWRLDEVVPTSELLDRVNERWPVRPMHANTRGEVACRYEYLDGQGEIGFVSSVSNPFCGSCSRARLSADGKLYSCLFATSGTDIKGLLRNGAGDTEIQAVLSSVWQARVDRYSEIRNKSGSDLPSRPKVEMYRVGG